MNALLASFDTNTENALSASGGLHLRVYDNIEDVREKWLRLEESGVTTIYQKYDWCRIWLKHFGKLRGITPCVLVAENEYGIVEFILPLQRRTSKRVTFIEILTTPQAGYGCGIFSRNFVREKASEWFALHFESLLTVLPPHDVLHLRELPTHVLSEANPLLTTRSFLGANHSYIMSLESDYEALYQRRRSTASRKSIRKRDAKLEALDGLSFDVPSLESDVSETMQIMFQQQEIRLAEAGIHNVFDSEERLFYAQLTSNIRGFDPVLRPFRLRVDADVIAVLLGGHYQGTYWALISSMSEGELKRFSPGDYILRRIIQTLCENGTTSFDFSAGDSPYKHHWSDQQIPLHFIVRCNTLVGLSFAIFLLVREKLKRVCKQTPVLNQLLMDLRRWIKGRRASV
jgi:CelD/BcsL family acetyltransferase involved in cellulose biosynthesis